MECVSMSNINIIHISNTPLVGAPGKISKTLNENSFNSMHVSLSDYPEKGGLAQKFIDNTIIYNPKESSTKELIEFCLTKADIIHIHNDIQPDFLRKIKNLALNAKFIYHVHSPLREGPLYFDRYLHYGIEFEKLLVVAQYHPRHYPDFIPVPNLVLTEPRLNLINDGEIVKVMYTPSHNRGGRWNSKTSTALTATLESLEKLRKIKLINVSTPVNQNTLFELRKKCHISIDEISTGAYHQVSLEGLCAGNCVINHADIFSKISLASVASSAELPPFIDADNNTIYDILTELSLNTDKIRLHQARSFDYFDKYLKPKQLIHKFIQVYHDVLS